MFEFMTRIIGTITIGMITRIGLIGGTWPRSVMSIGNTSGRVTVGKRLIGSGGIITPSDGKNRNWKIVVRAGSAKALPVFFGARRARRAVPLHHVGRRTPKGIIAVRGRNIAVGGGL
jgi:hypothetical protein